MLMSLRFAQDVLWDVGVFVRLLLLSPTGVVQVGMS